jgi:GT2 family glycosyltransferase
MATATERPRARPGAADPRVGVVILTYNRLAEVSRTVERMLALPERPRIVVVDNGSTDGTPEMVRRRFPEARCLRLSGNPGAAGRNAGVAALDTPYVALCDDDAWWEPGSLGRAADLLDAYPRLAVIAGRVLVGADQRLDPTCRAMAASPVTPTTALPGPAILGFLAGAAMVRRSAFLQVGGFERRFFIGGEEELVTLDLLGHGWELAYVADLAVNHHPSRLSRDTSARWVATDRNHLWAAWLRYPLSWAVGETVRVMLAAPTDPTSRAALAAALRGLPWALAHRRVIPPDVRRRLRQLADA